MEVQLGPTTSNVVDPSASINAANTPYRNHYDLHHHHHQNLNHLPQPPSIQQNGYYGYATPTPTPKMRKRKADSQDNQRVSKRLSKRLGLLHLGMSRITQLIAYLIESYHHSFINPLPLHSQPPLQ